MSTMQLQSFVAGEWRTGTGAGIALRDATTGEVIANASADGLDTQLMLAHAREVEGRGVALRVSGDSRRR